MELIPAGPLPAPFITFEGGEGSGKTTQIRYLAERLTGLGLGVLTTREPGGNAGAEAIRNLLVRGDADRWDPMTEALLMSAARREHLARTVWPALRAGQWVISDRYADSSRVYQGLGRGLGVEWIDALTRMIAGGFKPTLTLVLDLPVEEGLSRAQARDNGENRFESLGLEFHQRLRQGYLELAAREPQRFSVIDARPSPSEVAHAVWHVVRDRFNLAP